MILIGGVTVHLKDGTEVVYEQARVEICGEFCALDDLSGVVSLIPGGIIEEVTIHEA